MKRNICTLTDFVAHRPSHDPIVPPVAMQKRRPPRVEMLEQPAADFLGRALDDGEIGEAEVVRQGWRSEVRGRKSEVRTTAVSCGPLAV